MLTLDMTGLTAEELEKTVARHLAPFGRPTIVQLLPLDEQREYGMVAVRMSTPDEAHDLASKLGDSQFSSMVIIRLVQPGQRISSGSNSCGRSGANR